MKRTLAMLGVAALGALGALALSAPANADNPDCKTGTVTITDRVDSGVAGNWAKDTFTRKFEVCHVVPEVLKKDALVVEAWQYSVKLWDSSGSFVTTGVHSPMGHTMLTGINGSFNGALGGNLSVSGAFVAPANWLGWTAPTNTNTLSSGEFISALFKQGDTSKVGEVKYNWAWLYKTCNESWLNAAKGNHGDITGTLLVKRVNVGCADKPAFVDKCDESTEITLTNTAPNPNSVAVYNVNNLPQPNVFVLAKDSPKKVTVKPESHNTEVTYFNGKKIVVQHTWTMPKNCATPTPQPSDSGVVIVTPSAPTLPVTGSNTGYIAGVGAVLLGAGGVLFFLLRRHRLKFEA